MADDRIYSKIFTERNTQSNYHEGHSIRFESRSRIIFEILKAMVKGEITFAVMVEYSKVFDAVDYEILITKLYRLNFS